MAKLYWTKEIRQIMERELEKNSSALVYNNSMSDDQAHELIHHLQFCRSFLDNILEEMERKDAEHDEMIARYEAEKKAKEAEEPSDEQ